MLDANTAESLVRLLRQSVPQLMACYLFGSAARGEASSASDLDIAVLLPPGERIPAYLSLVARLSDVAGRQVDLVDLRQAGDFLRMEVLRDGHPLYVADSEQLLVWEGEAISEYGVHMARIRPLLEDFSRTGVGYSG